MSFDWNLFGELSERLKSERKYNNEESFIRTVISRYYYCVYHLLKNKKHYPRISHEALYTEYLESNIQKEKEMGANLKNLWILRRRSDYENEKHLTSSDLTTASAEYKNILRLLELI